MQKLHERKHVKTRHSVAAKFGDEAGETVRRCLDREPDPLHLQSMILAVTGILPPEKPDKLPRRQLEDIAGCFRRAIARERGKARSGHRSYNFNRHIALHQALRSLERLIGKRQ